MYSIPFIYMELENLEDELERLEELDITEDPTSCLSNSSGPQS